MQQNRHLPFDLIAMVCCMLMAVSCSSTSAIPDSEQLFTGLKKIRYINYEKNQHAASTQEEMEYVLASPPNGALMGSSYYRTPFPIRLWIWNAFANDSSHFARWMVRAFGSRPKLMSQINPTLRAQVATNQLHKYGYFNGKVNYDIITRHNVKKAQLAYTVNMGPLWRFDSVQYVNLPATTDSLLHAHRQETVIKLGHAFSIAALDSERQRIARLLRNNGYFFFEQGNTSYLADTLTAPGKVQLKLVMADSLEQRVYKQWSIGRVSISFRKQFMQQLTDSIVRRDITTWFSGRRPPMRTGVILSTMKLRPGQLYSADNEETTRKNLQTMGLFSYSSLQLTPQDSTDSCKLLDVNVNLVLDKPYDFYIETNAKGKTSGRLGPELVVGFTKRNAFRGGEKVDINLHGSYEWQTAHQSENGSSGINSYEYGADASLIIPRLLTPASLFGHWKHRLFPPALPKQGHRPLSDYATPTTTLKMATNILNRGHYFKRHVVSGELTYDFWTSTQSHHTFSPITLSYEYMQSKTAAFESLLSTNPYLQISMRDQLVPKLSYTYTYTSANNLLHPITWSVTVSEAGNILAATYMLGGEKWSTRNKTMFKNPFAQFFKIETDFIKQWHLAEHTTLVGHVSAGAIWSYANAAQAPYYEQFYVGGANSVRAFNVRSIGPGKYTPGHGRYSYIDQTGDVKFLANMEYRPRLWGNLYGAIFVDAGNVWTLHQDEHRPGGQFTAKDFMKQMAVGSGMGVRYDMGMFVLRLDWGVGLHVPYDTGRSGFYNVKSFKDAQSIHLAVGYPF